MASLQILISKQVFVLEPCCHPSLNLVSCQLEHDNDGNVRMVIVMAEKRWLVSTLMKPMCKVR
jgi:hypothetical protein